MAGGYLNRPDLELTAFHNGWYHSGDLGRTDTAGRLHILGRAADIIRVEALVLTPTMIEDTLCGVSSVRYAVVVVDPVAETWIAAVEAWAGVTVDTDCCVQAVAAAYGPDIARRLTMCPVSQVPRTAQGKPDRAAMVTDGQLHRATAHFEGSTFYICPIQAHVLNAQLVGIWRPVYRPNTAKTRAWVAGFLRQCEGHAAVFGSLAQTSNRATA